MKKTLYAVLLFLGINSIANEVVNQAAMNIDIKPNNEMKLLVDCSYKSKTFFGNKVYSEDSNINDFMNYLCKSTFNEKYIISYKDFYRNINNYAYENNFSWGYECLGTKDNPMVYSQHSRYVTKQQINDFKTQKLEYQFRLYQDHIFRKDIDNTFILPVVSLNTEFLVLYDFKMSEVLKPVEEKNFLKYEYELNSNSIKVFDIENPIKVDLKKHFSNTYDIDAVTECINGKEWVKKYGAPSGLSCNYKEVQGDKK